MEIGILALSSHSLGSVNRTNLLQMLEFVSGRETSEMGVAGWGGGLSGEHWEAEIPGHLAGSVPQ